MIRRSLCLLAFCALLAAPVSAGEPGSAASGSPSPEPVIREFLRALFTHDRPALLAAVAEPAGADALIGSNELTADEIASIGAEAARTNLQQSGPALRAGELLDEAPYPEGSRVVYTTGFRGMMLAIPTVHTAGGWKVDARYWLETQRNQETPPADDDPRTMAKGFLFHALGNLPEELAQFSTAAVPPAAIGIPNGLPGGDLDQILALCMEMPVLEARAGETVRLPSGAKAIAGEHAGERVFVGLMGPVEVPFLLRQVGGRWKVVPQNYFLYLRALGAI